MHYVMFERLLCTYLIFQILILFNSLFRWLAIRLDFCGNVFIFFAALLAVLQRDSLDPGKIALSITYALMVSTF